MASPWHDIDLALVNLFTDQMGVNSNYNTLTVATIKPVIVRSWADFDKWAFPAIAIVGTKASRTATEHGALGSRKLGKAYNYILIGLVEGTPEQANADIKEVDKRMEQALLVRNLTVNNEAFRIAAPEASALTSGRRASNVSAEWCYAATLMAVTIETST